MLKKIVEKTTHYLLPKVVKWGMQALLKTCRWEVEGLERFCQIAQEQKCILLFWHNRLGLAPFALAKLAPQFTYTAFVSNSQDGDLLSAVIHSFKSGRTIRVPHNRRHEALRTLIRHLETKKDVVIITPDGPRGPRYVMKPGAALAATETGAHIIILNWAASRYWTFNTWDAFRLPKPFATIKVSFTSAHSYHKEAEIPLVMTSLTHKLQEYNLEE